MQEMDHTSKETVDEMIKFLSPPPCNFSLKGPSWLRTKIVFLMSIFYVSPRQGSAHL